MSLELPYGIKVVNPKPLDRYYYNNDVPYTSILEVNTLIPVGVRYAGLTVNISTNEYWYKDGTDDTDLVPKLGGGIAGYVHNQGIANSIWNVLHNLNKKAVIVQVFDMNGIEYKAEVEHTDDNNTVIRFGFAMSGYAQFI
jgi:hypothetical protein